MQGSEGSLMDFNNGGREAILRMLDAYGVSTARLSVGGLGFRQVR